METRPISIVNFERCYLGAFLLGLVNTALAWSSTRAAFAASPQAAMLGGWFLPAVTMIGFAITISLWFFIARKGSAVAKWIVVVLAAFGLLGAIFSVLIGTYPGGINGILGIVSIVLQIVAITFLFKPDAGPWFGEKRVDPV